VFEDLPPNSGRVVISHRNEDSDFPAAFNSTLAQQGLGHLIPTLQHSDRWRHRQFGMALSGTVSGLDDRRPVADEEDVDRGDGGDGGATAAVAAVQHPLQRLNASALESAQLGTQFQVVVSTHANQTESRATWLAQLACLHKAATFVGPSTTTADVGGGGSGASVGTVQTDAAADRRAAHTAWWAQFWSRSHIIVQAATGANDTAVAEAHAVTQTHVISS
jgi:hypothetical protein